MSTLAQRFEQAIEAVLSTTPNPSPALHAYIAHIRARAVLAEKADESEKALEAWHQSVKDDSTWRHLSKDEQALFRATL